MGCLPAFLALRRTSSAVIVTSRPPLKLHRIVASFIVRMKLLTIKSQFKHTSGLRRRPPEGTTVTLRLLNAARAYAVAKAGPSTSASLLRRRQRWQPGTDSNFAMTPTWRCALHSPKNWGLCLVSGAVVTAAMGLKLTIYYQNSLSC
ncbi:hypothetical protein K449DRAFT_213630 [Hypoxylon sp. EC38]|nr:hypothetical protein K449DRAFT_213630 [Hypoxylon sp. EC38]